MNSLGIVVAFATFMGVWIGHVAVRKIEFIASTIGLPVGVFIFTGIVLEYLSLRSDNYQVSAFFGILGITVLWDALEFVRQQKRVQKGHAPANPNNPRHARILSMHASASQDPFRRDLSGNPGTLDPARGSQSNTPKV